MLRKQVRESVRAVRGVFANRNLRALQLAWAGSVLGGWAYAVALAVYAYDAGGATAVGAVGFVRWVVSAVSAPPLALLADRLPRRLVMVGSDVVRAVCLGAAAIAVSLSSPPLIVYALTILGTVATTAFGPARAALMPSLARSPEELTAANLATSTVESVGSFAGPALGGILLVATRVEVVFWAAALTSLWSAAYVLAIRVGPGQEEDPEPRERGLVRQTLAGFRTIAVEARLRLIVALFAAQTAVFGALNVLVVLMAIELLDFGQAGVGYLNSAVGVGGLVGSAVALGLAGIDRLRLVLGVGIALWGAPLALIGIWPTKAGGLVLLSFVGLANTLVDVAAYTLLQRAVPDDVLGRVFGVLETVVLGSIAVGSAVAPALVSAIGVRWTLVAVGSFLPAVAALAWRPLARVDAATAAPTAGLALLRGVLFIAPLAGPVAEKLAAKLRQVDVGEGDVVVREGEPGDRFYVVAEGEVEVSAGGREVVRLGPGGYFGEIALLRGHPRTATVTARGATRLYALARDDLVAAVTGHSSSREAADAVIATRLASLRPSLGSL